MLRAVRLAAKLDFTIAPETAAPFVRLGALLADAPPARLFDESLKLFLSGYGLKSFHALRDARPARHVFPATARALASDAADRFRALLERTLAQHRRARARRQAGDAGVPVRGAAVGPVRATGGESIAKGADPSSRGQRASDRIIERAGRSASRSRAASPAPCEEIWVLQPRFEQRVKKRVFRLLAHPRFRAAYDFLLLRSSESPALTELAEWWTQAQQVDHQDLARQFTPPPPLRRRSRDRGHGHGRRTEETPPSRAGAGARRVPRAARRASESRGRTRRLHRPRQQSRRSANDRSEARSRDLAHLPQSRLLRASRLFRTRALGSYRSAGLRQCRRGRWRRGFRRARCSRRCSRSSARTAATATARAGVRACSTSICCCSATCASRSPGCDVPHPHLAERAFVLLPLAEIAPGLVRAGPRPHLGAARSRGYSRLPNRCPKRARLEARHIGTE